MRTVITARPMRGALPVAVLPPTVDHPEHVTVRFVRAWHVFVNGVRDRNVFVGQTASGALCGVLGSEILLEDSGCAVSSVGYRTWRRASERAAQERRARLS